MRRVIQWGVPIFISLLVIILGVPILFDPGKCRILKTCVDCSELKIAILVYKLDVGLHPESMADLLDTTHRKEGYIESIPLDPWGNKYFYIGQRDDEIFTLGSYGNDGKEGGAGENSDYIYDHKPCECS